MRKGLESGCLGMLIVFLLVACSQKEDEALMYGAKNGDVRIVEMSLAHGGAVNVRDEEGWTPLLHAASQGHACVVEFLLQKGAGVDLSSQNRVTPLMAASLDGHVVVVEALLRAGANVQAMDLHGATPLMRAASRGHVATIKVLLAKGACIDTQNQKGETALMVAVKEDYLQAMEKSMAAPHLIQAARDDLLESVRILLAVGADFRIQDQSGKTMLIYARELGNPEIMRLMRQAIQDKP